MELKDCETCGETIPYKKKYGPAAYAKRRFCARTCIPYTKLKRKKIDPFIVTRYKWSEHEIAYLASLNGGYGFMEFVKKIYAEARGYKNAVFVLEVLNGFKEQTGRDLYAHLQNPDDMVGVTAKEYFELTGREVLPPLTTPRGKGAGNKKARQSGEMKTTQKVTKISIKEFNWGGLDPLGYNEN